jgi:hypothetical protein
MHALDAKPRGVRAWWSRMTRRARVALLAFVVVVAVSAGVAVAWDTGMTISTPTGADAYVNRATAVYTASAVSSNNDEVFEFVFTFPANADVSEVSAGSITVRHGDTLVDVPATSLVVDEAARTVSATFTSTKRGNVDRTLVVEVRDVVSPSEPGEYDHDVVLWARQRNGTLDDLPASSQPYALSANPDAPTAGTVTLSNPYAGGLSSYAFPLTVGTYGRLASNAEPGGVVTPNKIYVDFPFGTVLPETPLASSVTIDGQPLSSPPVVSGSGVALEIPDGLVVPANGSVSVLFTEAFGILNTTQGEYALGVSTSAESGTATSAFTIEAPADETPPVVTLSVVPPAPDGLSGWYVTVPAITASTDEPATVFYRFSETDEWTEWLDPSTPIPAGEIPQGASTLHYYAVDTASNASTVASYALSVDTVAPTTPVLAATAAGTSAIDLAWDPVADASSGVDYYTVFASDGTTLATTPETSYRVEGLAAATTYGFYLTATDIAGNTSAQSDTASATTDTGDITPPVVTLSVVPPAPDGLSGWYVTVPAITASTDEPATVFYSWTSEAGPWTLWADPSVPLADVPQGASTLHYYAVDTAATPAPRQATPFPSTPSRRPPRCLPRPRPARARSTLPGTRSQTRARVWTTTPCSPLTARRLPPRPRPPTGSRALRRPPPTGSTSPPPTSPATPLRKATPRARRRTPATSHLRS